jgi:hypothetical protein
MLLNPTFLVNLKKFASQQNLWGRRDTGSKNRTHGNTIFHVVTEYVCLEVSFQAFILDVLCSDFGQDTSYPV